MSDKLPCKGCLTLPMCLGKYKSLYSTTIEYNDDLPGKLSKALNKASARDVISGRCRILFNFLYDSVKGFSKRSDRFFNFFNR